MKKAKALSKFDIKIGLRGGSIGALLGAILAFFLFYIPDQMMEMERGAVLIGTGVIGGAIMGFIAGMLISVGVSRYRHHTADASAVPTPLR